MIPPNFDRFRPHPWHGLSAGPDPPRLVHAYVEITPFDLVKYEIDKHTGYLRVDRPQRTSSVPPTLYGFVPRTYCAERVRALLPGAERGDGDPLDLCVVSDRPIDRAEVILVAKVVGGIPMLDAGEADDKLVAVLQDAPFWGHVEDVEELPAALVERLRHDFATYKQTPDRPSTVRLGPTYGADHARRVVSAAMKDYRAAYGEARC